MIKQLVTVTRTHLSVRNLRARAGGHAKRAKRLCQRSRDLYLRQMIFLARHSPRLYRFLMRGTPLSLEPDYLAWLLCNYPRPDDLRRMRRQDLTLEYRPVISIITAVPNDPEALLEQAIRSVLHQTYPFWELCLVDGASTWPHVAGRLGQLAARDTRIRVCRGDATGGTTSAANSAIEVATGEFAAQLGHEDLLAPHALHRIALLLNQHPDADMVYSDEDKVEGVID